jgi:hypothetical protein
MSEARISNVVNEQHVMFDQYLTQFVHHGTDSIPLEFQMTLLVYFVRVANEHQAEIDAAKAANRPLYPHNPSYQGKCFKAYLERCVNRIYNSIINQTALT